MFRIKDRRNFGLIFPSWPLKPEPDFTNPFSEKGQITDARTPRSTTKAEKLGFWPIITSKIIKFHGTHFSIHSFGGRMRRAPRISTGRSEFSTSCRFCVEMAFNSVIFSQLEADFGTRNFPEITTSDPDTRIRKVLQYPEFRRSLFRMPVIFHPMVHADFSL